MDNSAKSEMSVSIKAKQAPEKEIHLNVSRNYFSFCQEYNANVLHLEEAYEIPRDEEGLYCICLKSKKNNNIWKIVFHSALSQKLPEVVKIETDLNLTYTDNIKIQKLQKTDYKKVPKLYKRIFIKKGKKKNLEYFFSSYLHWA